MRIGIIGTNWGLMHLGAFRAAGAEVVGLCGHDAEKTRKIAAREGVPLATTDASELCRAAEAVVVAGPDALHPEHVKAALGARRPVLCEKPLTRTAAEATELRELAESSGLLCAVNFPYRMLPPFAALRAWLRGRMVRRLVATVRNGFAAVEGSSDEGPLLGRSGDFGGASHVVDAALWLAASDPSWVQASVAGRPVHSVAMHVGLESGALLSLNHLAAPEPGIHGGWSVIGDDFEAGLSASYVPARNGWCLSAVRVFEAGQGTDLAGGVEPVIGEPEPWAKAHHATAREFVSALRGEAAPELARFGDGARVQNVLGAALDSSVTGRRVSV